MRRIATLAAMLCVAGMITTCGGGGDSGTGTPTATPTAPSVTTVSSGGDSLTGGGGSSTPTVASSAAPGFLRVRLTDKPAEDVQKVNVTISAVRVHQSADVGEGDGGWVELPVTAQMPVDLLLLRNGVLYDLCQSQLPAGHYQQVRLVLVPNAGAGLPYNQSVVTADGTLYPLEVPSGTVKIVHGFSVDSSATTDLTLDFDASQSVKQSGNGSWSMQPVIKPVSP